MFLKKALDSMKIRFKLSFKNIFEAFFCALLFSLPIYFGVIAYAYGIYSPFLNAILFLISIYVFVNKNKNTFFFGFFISVLWLYWVVFSFRFSNILFLAPFALIFLGGVYGALFYCILYFKNKFIRSIGLSLVSYISFFNFEWFFPDIMLAFSIFKVDKFSFIFIAFIVSFISYKNLSKLRFLVLIGLIFVIDFKSNELNLNKLQIKLHQSDIPQSLKWKKENLELALEDNFKAINDAIKENYDIVVLPESAFPLVLNRNEILLRKLFIFSNYINIIAGGLREEGGKYYNSTFLFSKNNYEFIDKVVLAPFGEYIPLPKSIMNVVSKFINYPHFEVLDSNPKDFIIQNTKFRNAICYEGGIRKMYSLNPSFMILISNNAWFSPSIEPAFQMMLIKYYARYYKTIVFHSANGSKSMIINPNMNLKIYSNL